MTGQQLHTYGRKGTKGAGELQYPKLCQEDSEGALLVADVDNHRLQLFDKRRKWSIVDVKPKIRCPARAVYVDNTLYVVDCIVKYHTFVAYFNNHLHVYLVCSIKW